MISKFILITLLVQTFFATPVNDNLYLNQLKTDNLIGSDMRLYTLNLPENINGSDLIINSKLTKNSGINDSPIIFVSLVIIF